MESMFQTKQEISILYVEDEQYTRNILFSMLETSYSDHSIFTASSGLKGLEMFRELNTDIVITDINMADMDGISMASEIKAIAPETIIIALTAHFETGNLMRAIEIGISHYVLKPIHFEQIRAAIDKSITNIRKDRQLRDQYEQISNLNAALAIRTQELELLNIELEAFNYTVAHDLRSPMACIATFSQSLLDQVSDVFDERSNQCLQVIYSETRRMNNIIESLLNFSRVTRKSIAKQWTNLSSIVYGIKHDLQLQEPGRQVSFTIGKGIKGYGDPILLGVVLENLLGNAWKYSAKNDSACIEFGSTTLGDEQIYYIRDNGVGFNQKDADQIFIPFWRPQYNSQFEGHGIGLATANRIIQRHGGRIWAEGEKGSGATFYFSL